MHLTSSLKKLWELIKTSIKGDDSIDYTVIPIPKAVVILAIPMILELSLESVFAVVDIFFVSKLGENAIASVGLTESVITIVYSIAIGLSTAATAMVARRIGAKKPELAAKTSAQVLFVAVLITLGISFFGVWKADVILTLMGASEDVVREGSIFTRIMFGGSFSVILIFLINGIFRGVGNAAIAMRSLWIGSIINIILDPILIHYMGLKGAAIATVIGRTSGVLYQCYFLFFGSQQFTIRLSHFKPDWSIIRSLLSISWPATLQFLIASGSWLILARLVADTGGTFALAGYQIAIRNAMFFLLPAWGLSNAAATLIGQNLGAKQFERAQQSVYLTAKYNAVFMSFVMILFVFFSEPILHIFTQDPQIVYHGTVALRIIGFGYIFYGIGMVMVQALNGAGDTKTPTWINLVSFWLFQVPLAFVLANYTSLGVIGVYAAIPIAETTIALFAWYFFSRGKWKQIHI